MAKTQVSTHSSRRKQLTVALVCSLALLLGIIVWMEFEPASNTAQSAASITSIKIKRAGHADISLLKTGSVWKMSAPYQLLANAQRIDPLLGLGTANFDGYDQSEVDLPATGLNTPAASITIGTREFLLGAPDVDGERRYTLVDEKVSFVPGWVWSLVHGGVTAFSDLTVFSELPDEVYLIQGTDVTRLTNIEQWQSLQADKISAWEDNFAQQSETVTEPTPWLLTNSDDPNAATSLATLLRLEDRTLINTQPGFAFAISNARLDALLSQ